MNNADQLSREFQGFVTRMLLAELAWAAIATAVFFACLYFVLRYAIRDGIRDAQRQDRRTTFTRTRDQIAGPDIRAD